METSTFHWGGYVFDTFVIYQSTVDIHRADEQVLYVDVIETQDLADAFPKDAWVVDQHNLFDASRHPMKWHDRIESFIGAVFL